MTNDFDELDRRLARLFEEGCCRKCPEEHPTPEKLSAYQANELPPEEADAILEHLVQCILCTDLFLDVERFLELPEEDLAREGVSDLGTEVWARILREEVGWKGPSRLRRSLRAFQALAAVLLVGMIGFSLYAIRLHGNPGVLQPILLTLSQLEGSLPPDSYIFHLEGNQLPDNCYRDGNFPLQSSRYICTKQGGGSLQSLVEWGNAQSIR